MEKQKRSINKENKVIAAKSNEVRNTGPANTKNKYLNGEIIAVKKKTATSKTTPKPLGPQPNQPQGLPSKQTTNKLNSKLNKRQQRSAIHRNDHNCPKTPKNLSLHKEHNSFKELVKHPKSPDSQKHFPVIPDKELQCPSMPIVQEN